jgi:DNA-binding response OmpR family regulator
MPDPSSGSDKTRRVVLLIDEDPKVGRLVRLSLHGPGCQVLATSRFLEGLHMAARHRPGLILMEVAFEKANGLELAQKLLKAPETRNCRVAFISSNVSPTRLVQGIQLGTQDYIFKPIEGKALSGRVDAIFGRISDGDALDGPVTGAGAQELAQLILQIEAEASTGVIRLSRPGQEAMVAFTMGKLQHAELGALHEDRALAAIAGLGDWAVTFNEGERPSLIKQATTSTTQLDSETDLESTQPRLPAINDDDDDDFQPETVAETPIRTVRPRPRSPLAALAPEPSLAPEAGLGGFPGEEDYEDKTMVDPNANPLANYDLATKPAEVVVPPGALSAPEQVVTISAEDSPIDLSETEEFYDDVPTPLQFKVDDDSIPSVTKQRPIMPPRADPTLKEREPPSRPPIQGVATAPNAHMAQGLPNVLEPPPSLQPGPVSAPQSRPLPTLQPPAPASPAGSPGAGFTPFATPGEGSAAPEQPEPEALRRYLAAVGQAPLVLIMPNQAVRATMEQAASAAGFTVRSVSSGQEAYAAAQEQRPLAFLSDTRLPDMEGREFLWAIRLDFLVREIPFLMASGDELMPKVAAVAEAAVAPILSGLESALGPTVQFHGRLINGSLGEISGRVEPVGLATLLRTIGATGVTGSLQLRQGDERNAEVVLRNGEICGATVNAPSSTVGPMAMLHLLGYKWHEYRFTRGQVSEDQVPLGSLARLVDTACKQNNILIGRVYQRGVGIEDIGVDRNALDLYLQGLPPDSLELLIRLVEGEAAAGLVTQGIAPQGILRSMLYELRRNAVIRPASLRPVRMEADLQPGGQDPLPATATVPQQAQPAPRRRRWLVALVAGLSTVALAAVGYFLYYRFLG